MSASRSTGAPAAPRIGVFEEEPFAFSGAEAPAVAGGPARPAQVQPLRRVLYGLVGLLLCVSSGLGNALVVVNTPYLAGSLSADSDQIAWLPVAYSMTFVSANLVLVRFRQQFGLRLFAMLGLFVSTTVILLHLLIGGVGGAVAVRAAAGLATAPLVTMAVYYIMASVPPKLAAPAVVLTLGLEQIPTPLARLLSPSLLDLNLWRALATLELGLGLVSLGAVALLRLPPSRKQKVFEPLDFVTYLLFSSGVALVCAVLGLGAVVWWADRQWFGVALAVAVPLIGAALTIELLRARPLIDVRWLTGPEFLRFTLVAVTARVVLSEQGSATNLLRVLGVANEELQVFSFLLVLSTVLGAVAAAAVFRPGRIGEMAALAIALVALGAFVDSHATDLSRPYQFYGTQMMIAFAGAMFIGPALLFGIGRVLQTGGGELAGYVVLFSITQNLGGLAGSALLGTFEILREKTDSSILVGLAPAFDPATQGRVAALSRGAAAVVTDPQSRAASGVAALQQQATQQANVLAYDNTFMLVAVIAAAVTVYITLLLAVRWAKTLAKAQRPQPATQGGA